MNPITNHILTATGDVAAAEPDAIHGDWLIVAFVAGLVLGWVIGALA